MQFFGDDFLRVLLLRFIFCHVVLSLHKFFKVSTVTCHQPAPWLSTNSILCLFQGASYYPKSYPIMPKEEILENDSLRKLVLELSSVLEVQGLFNEHSDID